MPTINNQPNLEKINKLKQQLLAAFSLLFIIIVLGAYLLFGYYFKQSAFAITGNYGKLAGDSLENTDWNNLVNDFVDASGDTMTGALTINGGAGKAELKLKTDAAANYWSIYAHETWGDLNVWYGGNVLTVDKDTGNVGVGTPNPAEKLDVVGNIKASGVICDSNGCIGEGEMGTSLWSQNGTSIYYNTGNVGIRTDNPAHELVVRDATGQSGIYVLGSGVNAELALGDGANHWAIYSDETGTDDLRFWRGDNRMVITDDGKVGIGTANPSLSLDVVGGIISQRDGGNQYSFKTSSRLWSLDVDVVWNDSFRIRDMTGGTAPFVITTSGEVGINNSNPSEALDVVGNVKASGIICDSNGCIGAAGAGDNLGNHIAEMNINLDGHWLSGDGGNEGVFVTALGNVGVGANNPLHELVIRDVTGQSAVYIWGDTKNAELALGDGANHWAIYSDETGTDDLRFWRGDNRMVITDDGKVGIGTVNPAQALDVAGQVHATGDICTDQGAGYCLSTVVSLVGDITGVAAGFGLTGGGASGDVTLNVDCDAVLGHACGVDNNTTYGVLANQGLRLSGVDFGLINTCAVNQVLSWNGTSWVCASQASGSSIDHGELNGLLDDDHTQYLLISGARAMAGALKMSATGENDITAVDEFVGYNDLFLKGNAGETAPIYYGASAHHFYTAGTEKLTILNSGNVGVGVLNPAVKLDVNGTVQAVDFLYSSDRNLKENIEPISGALGKVLRLNGVLFKWRGSGETGMGLIAQDVEEVFPEAVFTDGNTGLKSLRYGNLTAPLIEAIKEQQAEIEKLRTEIEELKNK